MNVFVTCQILEETTYLKGVYEDEQNLKEIFQDPSVNDYQSYDG